MKQSFSRRGSLALQWLIVLASIAFLFLSVTPAPDLDDPADTGGSTTFTQTGTLTTRKLYVSRLRVYDPLLGWHWFMTGSAALSASADYTRTTATSGSSAETMTGEFLGRTRASGPDMAGDLVLTYDGGFQYFGGSTNSGSRAGTKLMTFTLRIPATTPSSYTRKFRWDFTLIPRPDGSGTVEEHIN